MSRKSNIHKDSHVRESNAKKCSGFYVGIVVQNNDPEQRGRVKVFVPHVSAKIHKNWDGQVKDQPDKTKRHVDKKFKFPDKHNAPDFTNILDELKPDLPWAECASPLMGESGSGRYNAKLRKGSISDSARLETTQPVAADTDDYSDVNTKYKLNDEGIGESPGYIHESSQPLTDSFSTTTTLLSSFNRAGNKIEWWESAGHTSQENAIKDNKTEPVTQLGMPVNINKFAHNYKPSTYSNVGKGIFSIPGVGSHVWVWFEDGNPMDPVYFAVAHGKEDWRGIHGCGKDDDHGIDYPGTYENKSDRDDPTYNHNTEIYRNKFVFNQKGGNIEIVSTDNRELLKMTHFSGSFKEFNNLTNIEFAKHSDQKIVGDDLFLTVKGSRNECSEEEYDLIVRGDHYRKVGTFNLARFQQWQTLVQGFADIKQLFEVARTTYKQSEISDFQFQSPIQSLKGTYMDCPMCLASGRTTKMWDISQQGVTSLSTPTVDSSNQDVYNTVSPIGDTTASWSQMVSPDGGPASFLGDYPCPVCAGTGISPSSLGGTWSDEVYEGQTKQDLILEKSKHLIDELVPIEKELGLGGSEIVHITKHRLETVGLLMNTFPSMRIDPVGKLENNEVLVRPGGVVTSFAPTPLIEAVHVDDLPGGTYTLNACNRYNVQVGAGGISMKSYGPVDIGGTLVNVAGEQVNLSSANEINIVAGKRVSIVAEILSLRQKSYQQVLVDSSLGVSRNLVVRGGAHIEGELTVNHITAPVEIQETEQTKVYAKPVQGKIIGYVGGGGDDYGNGAVVYGNNADDDSILCYGHSHQFKNVPLHLMKSSDDVRAIGMKNTTHTTSEEPQREPISPAPVENQNKGGGSGQLGEST